MKFVFFAILLTAAVSVGFSQMECDVYNSSTEAEKIDGSTRILKVVELWDNMYSDLSSFLETNNASSDLEVKISHFEEQLKLLEPTQTWFSGQYALLKSETGCPHTFSNLTSYVQIHEESSKMCQTKNNNSHLAQPLEYEKDGDCFLRLQFCESNVDAVNELPWPAGSYCINKKTFDECPHGFSEPWLVLDQEDDNVIIEHEGNVVVSVHENDLPFCCLTSGSAAHGVAMPTSTAFYLYRIGGHCQKVIGMNVTTEFLDIDTEDYWTGDVMIGAPAPDVQFTGGVNSSLRLYLCYYEPTS